MNRKYFVTVLALLSLVGAIAVGAVAYRSASAAVSTLESPVANFSGLEGQDFDEGVPGEYLAEALGISVEELKTAVEEAKAAGLAQAVEQGLITQAQADDLAQTGRAFPFGNQWGKWLAENGIDRDELLADALGISVEELQAAYAQAFNARIDQAVADGKLTEERADLIKGQHALRTSEDFQNTMQTAFETAVAQAVSDGVITQAQADQILENQGSGVGGWGAGGPDGPGGRGDRGPRGNAGQGFQPPAAP